MSNRKRAAAAAAALGAALAGGGLAAPSAQAQAPTAHPEVNVSLWGSFNTFTDCQAAADSLLVNFCFESASGQVLGYVDPLLALDDIDQGLGVANDDVVDIPFTAPAGAADRAAPPANSLKEVYYPAPAKDPGSPKEVFTGGGGPPAQASEEASGNYSAVPPGDNLAKNPNPPGDPWVAVQTYTSTPQGPTPVPPSGKSPANPPKTPF